MNTVIDLCFLCTKDYNCVPVDHKIVSQVEYVLPEITIFNLGIPLRICSVCDGALYAFSKFKQFYVESTLRLEANIKGAQGPPLHTGSPPVIDSQPYNTNHNKPQHGSGSTTQMAQPSLHTDNTSKEDQEFYNNTRTDKNSELDCTKNNTEGQLSAYNSFNQIYENSGQEMGPFDPLLHTDDSVSSNTNLEKIEDIYIKEEQIEESSSDMEYFNSEEKDFQCNICNVTFTLKSDLISHLKSHTGVKDYKCSVCNKMFRRRFNLNLHMKVHSGIKDFLCHICNKPFIQQDDFIRHMEIHTGGNYLNYNNQEQMESTAPELREEAENISGETLPEKSKLRYERAYQVFVNWCDEKKIYDYTETVLLDYFKELVAQNRKSLWAIYSMLKSCIMIHKDIDISKYPQLSVYLKKQTLNYKPKKSKTLKEEHINSFIDEAPDDDFLMMKVVLVIGLSGALRREELYHMVLKNVELKNDIVIITIPDTKFSTSRQFAIINTKWVALVKKYLTIRYAAKLKDRFFLKYQKGRCINSPVGINTMGSIPSKIANFLKLENYREYTGHCFRRSSASLLANRGDLLTLKTYGGQKSTAVVENYDESYLKRKMDAGQMNTDPGPSTSKISNTTYTEIKIEDTIDY